MSVDFQLKLRQWLYHTVWMCIIVSGIGAIFCLAKLRACYRLRRRVDTVKHFIEKHTRAQKKKKRLQQLHAKRCILKDILQPSTDHLWLTLERIAALIPPDNRCKMITYKKKKPLNIKGEAIHPESIQAFVSALNSCNSLPPAHLLNSSKKKSFYQYELRLDV